MSESKTEFHQVTSAADNGQSSSSWRNHRVGTSFEEKSEMGMKVEEVRQLNKMLTHLEQETHTMKQEMLKNAAERKKLMNDVYRQLKRLQFSLRLQNQSSGYEICEEGGRPDGLSQVLYQDWNSSVVIRRGSRAYSVSVKHLRYGN
ncbi:uncharacterized protein LOC112510137 isoform X2 [Cynara cardunculus var. scolymus]|uniref:uncharacterized protein LOC112510137 isoform X2 n=1 Tax=Cynara cardunculus var. scolymus TaxID=59895 RepID=UPI000D6259F8|nr:uncharacterized protein LOC112510137 isoform X2 [Cynara cardunculus var. scolymus]